jgi:hypothetical protein
VWIPAGIRTALAAKLAAALKHTDDPLAVAD